MKFEKQFFFSIIPEWRMSYIDYTALIQQIGKVKEAALELARSYSNIHDITGEDASIKIDINGLSVEQTFWEMLEENIDKVEQFFLIQFARSVQSFHILVFHAIRLGFINEYEPFKHSTTTRLQRELERLKFPSNIIFDIPDKSDRIHHESTIFLPIYQHTQIEDILNELVEQRLPKYPPVQDKSLINTKRLDSWESDDDLVALWASDAEEEELALAKNKQLEQGSDQNDDIPVWNESSDEDLDEDLPFNVSKTPSLSLNAYRIPSTDGKKTITKNELSVYNSSGANSGYDSGPNEDPVDSVNPMPSTLVVPSLHPVLTLTANSLSINNSSQMVHPILDRDNNTASTMSNMNTAIPITTANMKTLNPIIKPKTAQGLPEFSSSKPHPSPLISEQDEFALTVKQNVDSSTLASKLTANFPPSNKRDPVSHSYGQTHIQDNVSTGKSTSHYDNNIPPTSGNDGYQSNNRKHSGHLSRKERLNTMIPPFQQDSFTKRNNVLFSTDVKSPFNYLSRIQPRVDNSEATAILKSAWIEFYRSLELLNRFALLNREALEKILTKHDKNIQKGTKHLFIHRNYNLEGKGFAFFCRSDLKLISSETEHVYAQAFTSGHRTVAMRNLRFTTEEKAVGQAMFRFGFFLGISAVWFLVLIFLCSNIDISTFAKLRPAFIVFRMLALMTLFIWMWGFQILIWKRHRVNYYFIFHFARHMQIHYHTVFDTAALFTFLHSSCLLLFLVIALQYYHKDVVIPMLGWMQDIPLPVLPLTSCVLMLLGIIYSQFQSNWWIAKSLWRVILTPLYRVNFLDFYIAETLISSAVILYDLRFSLCYFIVDGFQATQSCSTLHNWSYALLIMLPLAWRGLQSLRRWHDVLNPRYLVNSYKYGLAILLVILSLLSRVLSYQGILWSVLWILTLILLTFALTYWDVFRDWSLQSLQPSQTNSFKLLTLRSQLLYPTWWYYFAITLTPLLRLFWLLTLSPDIMMNVLNPDFLITTLAIVEIGRRFMWNILRAENEQIDNAHNFRAVQDMSYLLIDLPQQSQVAQD